MSEDNFYCTVKLRKVKEIGNTTKDHQCQSKGCEMKFNLSGPNGTERKASNRLTPDTWAKQ